ncbi:MAG: lysophospholipase [Anaerolineae bacterium]|nr:MAG: lysophospholipase [Anaerolineae bacterium]WKZ42953.1 MAG: GDSL-type esterase/lipase family protein [Anaerolineales bacterium]
MTNRIKKIGLIAFSAALIGLIAMNTLLYRELRKYYTLLYESELDPIGLTYFQDESLPQTNNLPVVVFFGDSRAAQWPAPQIEGFTFINRGIGNQTSTQVLLRYEEHVQPLKPKIVIIQVCINDLKTLPLFAGRETEIIENCKANIQEIIKKSLSLKSTVILTTIFPTSGDVPLTRRPVWSDDIYLAIEEVNSFILNMHMENVIVFDAASILSDSDGNTKEEYVFDLLHLNNNGYNALNLELSKILESLK